MVGLDRRGCFACVLLGASLGCVAQPLMAQVIGPEPVTGPAQRPPHPFYRGPEGVEVSLGAFAQLTGSRNSGSTNVVGNAIQSQQISQSASPSAGLLATVRQSFGPLVGYSINIGFTRFVENYTNGASSTLNVPPYTNTSASFSRGSISTNAFELTGAYVVHAPTRRNFTPFAQLGGGFLTFLPTPTDQPVSYVYRGTGLAGLGVSFRLGPRVELRAEERVLFFKSPDFRYGEGATSVSGPPVPVTSRYTVAQEPTLSLSYRFGGPKPGMQ